MVFSRRETQGKIQKDSYQGNAMKAKKLRMINWTNYHLGYTNNSWYSKTGKDKHSLALCYKR